MGKPRLIILVRHAQSEGNKNREIHQTTPDHRVKLTAEGWRQSQEAGRKLRSLLRPDDTLHFFTSPYRRTRETTEGILSTLTADDPSPSPFPRHTIKVYEEPRIREQDFGNFQPSSEEMSRMWHERAAYGHFFYRIPNGESAADAYDRVAGFNESLWRSFGEDDFASVCVLVTHGLMSRVFLMKWYHWSVEYFEDLRNVNHCEFIVMRKSPDSGKFVLQNKMRTWSELKREKEREAAQSQGRIEAGRASPIPMRKRWGDAQSSEDEFKKLPQRQNTIDLFRDDDSALEYEAPQERAQTLPAKLDSSSNGDGHRAPRSAAKGSKQRKQSDRVSALNSGRDGGGTDTGGSEDDDTEREGSPPAQSRGGKTALPQQRSMALALNGRLSVSDSLQDRGRRPSLQELRESNMNMSAKADALGDHSENDDDDADRSAREHKSREEEFEKIKKDEESFAGSVR